MRKTTGDADYPRILTEKFVDRLQLNNSWEILHRHSTGSMLLSGECGKIQIEIDPRLFTMFNRVISMDREVEKV